MTLRIAARAALERDGGGRAGRAWRLLVGPARASPAERYGVALGLAAVAVGAGLLLDGERAAFRVVLYVAAVAIAALRGGVGPGLAALAVCAAVYGGGRGSPTWLEEPDPVHRLVFFAGFSALAVWAASALREGYRQVHARRRRAEARADAQRVAAELGVRALAEENLDALLAETLSAVQRALRCEAVTLLELQPDGDGLLLRNGSGLGGELVGKVFGPAQAPLAFRALLAREPLAVDDLAADPELASPPLIEAGIHSSLVAPVVAPGPGGRPFGVMGAHSASLRSFSVDEAIFLQTAANVVGTAVVRLRAEERVRRSLAAAQEATRAREQVLEVVSHDLKAPLGALLMGAQMVDRLAPPGVPGDDLRRASGTVRRAAQRMGRLIHDLVDGASIEAGGLSLQIGPHDARAVASEAVEALRDVALDRHVALELRCEGAAPPVACDRDRVVQVLCNLLANALHVTDDGGGVEVAVRQGAEGEVRFTVADEGPGIPADDLPHIFERWYRGRGAKRYPGSGLGLSIAHAIVGAHGGRIWAETREGAGTTFSFVLPSIPGQSTSPPR